MLLLLEVERRTVMVKNEQIVEEREEVKDVPEVYLKTEEVYQKKNVKKKLSAKIAIKNNTPNVKSSFLKYRTCIVTLLGTINFVT